MNINWKVRLRNKQFWLYAISAILALSIEVLPLFGVNFTAAESQEVMNIVQSVLTFLAVMGVIMDPTTEGLADSVQAQTYTVPKKKGE